MKYTMLQASRKLDITYGYLGVLCRIGFIKREGFEYMGSHKRLIDSTEIERIKPLLSHKKNKKCDY